jgi:hypothetical protein
MAAPFQSGSSREGRSELLPSNEPVVERDAEESYSHFLAREVQIVLRWVVFISAALVVLLMFTFVWFAVLPAAVMIIAYGLLLIADFAEYRTYRPGYPGHEEAPAAEAMAAAADRTMVERERIAAAVHLRLRRTIAGIVGGAAIAALAVVGFIFGRDPALRPVLGIGAMILFAYILLVAAPFWMGWIEEQADEEKHRIEDEIDEEDREEPVTSAAGDRRPASVR